MRLLSCIGSLSGEGTCASVLHKGSSEGFCIENHLDAKNILKSEATLKGLGISVSKRLVEMVKGLRMKTDEDREREEEMEARRLARIAEREAMASALAGTVGAFRYVGAGPLRFG